MRGVLVVSVLALCKVWCDRAFAAEVCETATGRGCEGVNDGAAFYTFLGESPQALCNTKKRESEMIKSESWRPCVPRKR